VVDADGAVTLVNDHQAIGRMSIAGNTVTIDASAAVTANDSILVSALSSLVSRGALIAGQNINLVSNGALIASGTVGAHGQVILQVRDISAASLVLSGSQVQVVGVHSVNLDAVGIAANGDIRILSSAVELGPGTGFEAQGLTNVDARQTLTNGTVLNGANLQVSVHDSYIGTSFSALVADNLQLTLTDRIDNAGALIGTTSLALSSQTLTNAASGVIAAPEVTISVPQSLANLGSILSERTLAITAGAMLNDGMVKTNGDLRLNAQSYAAHSTASVIAAANARVVVAGTFDNAGRIIGQSLVSLTAGALINRGTSASISGGVLSLVMQGDVTNEGVLGALQDATLTIGGGLASADREPRRAHPDGGRHRAQHPPPARPRHLEQGLLQRLLLAGGPSRPGRDRGPGGDHGRG
jgi:filamentous hemagglutinin